MKRFLNIIGAVVVWINILVIFCGTYNFIYHYEYYTEPWIVESHEAESNCKHHNQYRIMKSKPSGSYCRIVNVTKEQYFQYKDGEIYRGN